MTNELTKYWKARALNAEELCRQGHQTILELDKQNRELRASLYKHIALPEPPPHLVIKAPLLPLAIQKSLEDTFKHNVAT